MAKLSLATLTALVASTSAFVPQSSGPATSALCAGSGRVLPFVFSKEDAEDDSIWDPMGLYELGEGKDFDTFPNMFPAKQFLDEAEIKHGRQAMLAWTGIWATHKGGLGLGLHIPGMPDEDWTTALPVFAKEQPALFGAILAFIFIAEGEGVSWSGDNFEGKGTKEPGFQNYDPLGLQKKWSDAKNERMKLVERKNGRAAMIAMASMFAFESIPGSVPIMDLLGAS